MLPSSSILFGFPAAGLKALHKIDMVHLWLLELATILEEGALQKCPTRIACQSEECKRKLAEAMKTATHRFA